MRYEICHENNTKIWWWNHSPYSTFCGDFTIVLKNLKRNQQFHGESWQIDENGKLRSYVRNIYCTSWLKLAGCLVNSNSFVDRIYFLVVILKFSNQLVHPLSMFHFDCEFLVEYFCILLHFLSYQIVCLQKKVQRKTFFRYSLSTWEKKSIERFEYVNGKRKLTRICLS